MRQAQAMLLGCCMWVYDMVSGPQDTLPDQETVPFSVPDSFICLPSPLRTGLSGQQLPREVEMVFGGT